MSLKYSLKPEELTNLCNLDNLTFETTENLKPLKGIIGQKRGIEALSFGLRMKKKGYNIYVSGISGTGRSSFTNSITEGFSKAQPVPSDWVYVYNFDKKDSPKALRLEPGHGRVFKEELEGIIENLKKLIPDAFEGREYETRKKDIYKIINEEKGKILKVLNEKSSKYGFVYSPMEEGLLSIPLKDGRPMNEEEYQALSVMDRDKLAVKFDDLHLTTFEELDNLEIVDEELNQKLAQLDKNLVYDLANYNIKKLIDKFDKNLDIVKYLHDLEKDIMNNIDRFKPEIEEKKPSLFDVPTNGDDNFFIRYKVNLFVDNSKLTHAPIINESNPIYNNLVGTIEYKSHMGVLATDFMQIRPGSLHQANGGYLIFQIKEILNNHISWEMLKRALKTDEINIENLNRLMGLTVTSSLIPEPIPLDLKVIIIGDDYNYSRLYAYDDDFRKLFKVMAAFDIEMKKDVNNIYLMAEFIASHCDKNNMRHFDKNAVVRVIEYSSRLSEHQDKMSTRFNKIEEILYEADLWAEDDKVNIVTDKHIQKAIDKKAYRSNIYEEKLNEMFLDGSILIDVTGEEVGQINGLAVMGTGEYSFGKPSRITASVYRGEEGIINIEREANQSGSMHDKGVLIISGYLGQKYATYRPLGLNVGIGFEQNYSVIDGDSASSTELYAILSSIARVPIKQYIAVTGSVNQKGEIQPIGGVNEKIEGFYEVCKLNGLTKEQGVLIPKKNIKNLMLKQEVIESVRNNEFHIYAINNIDEGIKILTGLDAGVLDDKGEYQEGTLNYLITENLKSMQKYDYVWRQHRN